LQQPLVFPAQGKTSGANQRVGSATLCSSLWFSLLCSSSRKTSRAIPKGLALLQRVGSATAAKQQENGIQSSRKKDKRKEETKIKESFPTILNK
jgi:hypothetical protein